MHSLLERGGFVNGAVSRHILLITDYSDAVTACALLLLTHTHTHTHTHTYTHTQFCVSCRNSEQFKLRMVRAVVCCLLQLTADVFISNFVLSQ